MKTALTRFKRCAEGARDGSFQDAKRLNDTIGETCDDLIVKIRSLGLKADNCDLIFEVEATIYNYVKRSNPANELFAKAEAYGSALEATYPMQPAMTDGNADRRPLA